MGPVSNGKNDELSQSGYAPGSTNPTGPGVDGDRFDRAVGELSPSRKTRVRRRSSPLVDVHRVDRTVDELLTKKTRDRISDGGGGIRDVTRKTK